ncbi:MAG: lysylphosphatidylglycerol synthase transmembrane domain-containing protein, partial [Acidobacteriota bacterium]
ASGVAFLQPQDDFHKTLSYITWGLLVVFISGGIAVLFFTDLVASLLERRNRQRWVDRLRDLTSLTRGFIWNYRVVGTTFLLSVGAQALGILAVHQLSLAIGGATEAASMFIVVPLVFLVTALPISVGGLGTREFAFVYLLSNVGLDKTQGTTVALLSLAVNLLTSLPGAASYPMIRAIDINE